MKRAAPRKFFQTPPMHAGLALCVHGLSFPLNNARRTADVCANRVILGHLPAKTSFVRYVIICRGGATCDPLRGGHHAHSLAAIPGGERAYTMPNKTDSTNNTVQALTIRPTEAAKLAGLSTRTITRMCTSGELPAVKLHGKTWLINRGELMRIIGVQA